MTKPTSSKLLALVLAAVAFCACGSDPYSGTSTNSSTGIKTVTTSGTLTTTVGDTDGNVTTVTGTWTGTATSTQTSPSTATATDTSASTGPLTVTVTSTMTVTGTSTENPDAGVNNPDTAPVDPSLVNIYIGVAPNRLLDLVFMVDNSPSMAPKVSKMNAQFPKLIAALKDPSDQTLPNLRVAVIDSDLGTGGQYPQGSCGIKTLPDGTVSNYGDLGRFQMLNAPTACTFNPGALFLEYLRGQAVNYAGDINTVFACLASNLGTLGCGEEHQLQAFEFALAAQGTVNETQQKAFLRGNAQLGLVFLTDEDDCSAATNDGLFGDKPELRGESASLRCATRAHACGGKNLTSSPPGYPTDASFTHNFNDCQARMGDECDFTADTSVPTTCNPLKSVRQLAEEMKALKSNPDQVFVAGIFGWPVSDADMATAQYKIAPIPNPNTADTVHPTVYDYWPVCYDPDHMPSATSTDKVTGYDWNAAGWGATGGLRESAFVDEFGGNGMKFSICQRDFSASMQTIGNALARKMEDFCVDYKLRDTDLSTPGLQTDCEVHWAIPAPDPNDPTKVIYSLGFPALSQCPAGSTNGNVAQDCWQLTNDTTKCPVNGQMFNALRTVQEVANKPQLDPGTQVKMSCHICIALSSELGCMY